MDAYGDLTVLSGYAGSPVRLPKGAEWQHGWIPSTRDVNSPEQIIGSDGRSRFRKDATYFVARASQASRLRQFGYTSVEAIGLPILYVDDTLVPTRNHDAFLAVPHHSAIEHESALAGHDGFASYLAKNVNTLGPTTVLVHGIDWKMNIQHIYERRGLSVLRGALEANKQSLDYVARLFQSFGTVLSNELASPIAYAAYFGARVAVVHEPPKVDLGLLFANNFYRNCIEGAVSKLTWESDWRLSPDLEFLLQDPTGALPAQDWARFELGARHKLAPSEVRSRFAALDAETQAQKSWRTSFGPSATITAKGAKSFGKRTVRRLVKRFRKRCRPMSVVLEIAGPGERLRNAVSFVLGTALRRKQVFMRASKSARPFWVRLDATDLLNVEQHFLRDELGELADLIQEASLIIDAGAYCGYSVLRFRDLNSRAKVVALEPVRENFRMLVKNTAGLSAVHSLNVALWVDCEGVDVHEASEGAWSATVLEEHWSSDVSPEHAQSVTWDELLEAYRSALPSTILKMDVEGAESRLFAEDGLQIVADCAACIIEVHDWYPGVAEQFFHALLEIHKKQPLEIYESGEFIIVRRQVTMTGQAV